MQNLRAKARDIYDQRRNGSIASQQGPVISTPDHGEDELAIFGGQTRVFISKHLSHPRSSRKHKEHSNATADTLTPPSDSPSPPTSNSSSDTSELLKDVHPSLVEYLNTAPLNQFASANAQDLGNLSVFDMGGIPASQPFDATTWPGSMDGISSLDQGNWGNFPQTSFGPEIPAGSNDPFHMLPDQPGQPSTDQVNMTDQWQMFMDNTGFFTA